MDLGHRFTIYNVPEGVELLRNTKWAQSQRSANPGLNKLQGLPE